MRVFILERLLGALSRGACSPCSAEPRREPSPCGGPQRLPHSRTPVGCASVATTWRALGARRPHHGPSRPGCSTDQRPDQSTLSPNVLAFHDLIMDDKSMQSWSTVQLTLVAPPGTMGGMTRIGRPRKPVSPTDYESSFRQRVRIAREQFSSNAADMARALGVAPGTYNRYETRTMMPMYLIPKFIKITGVPLDWLVHGPAEAHGPRLEDPHPGARSS
jgi:hypothetical protein